MAGECAKRKSGTGWKEDEGAAPCVKVRGSVADSSARCPILSPLRCRTAGRGIGGRFPEKRPREKPAERRKDTRPYKTTYQIPAFSADFEKLEILDPVFREAVHPRRRPDLSADVAHIVGIKNSIPLLRRLIKLKSRIQYLQGLQPLQNDRRQEKNSIPLLRRLINSRK